MEALVSLAYVVTVRGAGIGGHKGVAKRYPLAGTGDRAWIFGPPFGLDARVRLFQIKSVMRYRVAGALRSGPIAGIGLNRFAVIL